MPGENRLKGGGGDHERYGNGWQKTQASIHQCYERVGELRRSRMTQKGKTNQGEKEVKELPKKALFWAHEVRLTIRASSVEKSAGGEIKG